MKPDRPSRIEFETVPEGMIREKMAHDVFARRGTADVAHADEKDPDRL